MSNEKAPSTQRAPRSKATSSRDAANGVERLKISRIQPSMTATISDIGPVHATPRQRLLDAVEEQRVKLLNVLRIVHYMSASFGGAAETPAPEVAAAFALLEQEIRRVIARLRPESLLSASRRSNSILQT